MKNFKKCMIYGVLALLSCTLMGNTTDTAQKAKTSKSATQPIVARQYDSTVQALRDSIAWYRSNWKLNEDMLTQKRKTEKNPICN